MRTVRGWPVMLAALLMLAPGRAGAQYRGGRGYGYGAGYGGYGYRYGYVPYYYSPASPESLLYREAMLNASRATMGPVIHGVYDGRPASYIYHLHDPGYLDGMDVATRRRIEARIGRFSDGPPPPEPRPVPAPAPAAPPAGAGAAPGR